MTTKTLTIALAAALVTSACGTPDNAEYERQLREALAESDVTLTEAISVAESETYVGAARIARLHVDGDRVFTVSAYEEGASSHEYAIALSGDIVGDDPINLSGGSCGSKTLGELVAIAEAEVGGEGVAIELDDDEGCQYEVQVLTADDLMEVEVTGEGSVSEVEISDDGAGDD